MKTIFISFQQNDRRWAEWVAWTAEEAGYECYLQTWDSARGENFVRRISKELDACDCFLAVLSRHYLDSEFCQQELTAFLSKHPNPKDKPLLVIKIDAVAVPTLLSAIEFIDLSQQKEEPAARTDLLGALSQDRRKPQLAPAFPNSSAVEPAKPAPGAAPTPAYPQETLGISEAFTEFAQYLQDSEDRLRSLHESKSLRVTLPVREPNFLVFQRAGKLVLTISDRTHKIDDRALQPSNRPKVRATLAKTPLPQLGYSFGFAHPMFYDHKGLFDSIIIDGILLFQFLYFPASQIFLPFPGPNGVEKRKVSISSFIRVLLAIHGSHKVLFAPITRRSWPDSSLLAALQTVNCFTRFAPTPSNSLHLGNVRSAMIPYLLARRDPEENIFALRFDDTNAGAVDPAYEAEIREDLKWLGFRIDPTYEFRQTESAQTENYRHLLSVLKRHNFVKTMPNGEGWLDHERTELNFLAWLDLNKGPIIKHAAPLRFADGAVGDLSLRRTADGAFKYKYAGLVDDLICFSHVVRDQRQEYLTDRQALIRTAIFRAWNSGPQGDLDVEVQKQVRQSRAKWLGSKRAPFPFLAPPLYIHVSLVADENGKPLRKRQLQREFSLRFCRIERNILPESIVSLIASTIVSPAAGESPHALRRALAVQAGQLGAPAFLDVTALSFSLANLVKKRKSVRIAAVDIERQERWVIDAMSFGQFRRHLNKYADRIQTARIDQDTMERAYSHRTHFSSWREVLGCLFWESGSTRVEPRHSSTFLGPNSWLSKDDSAHVFSAVGFSEALKSLNSAKRDAGTILQGVRLQLIGGVHGPSFSVLRRVLGYDELVRRLTDKARHP